MTENPYSAVRRRRWRRQIQLEALGYRDYREYLRSSHWANVKDRYRASDQPQDCICGAEEVDLHHLTYERIGAEELVDLTPLCRRCHAMIHELERRGEMGLDFAGLVNAERAEQRRLDLEARTVEWPEEYERVLASMHNLRNVLKVTPRAQKRSSRAMWTLRSALDRAEREMRKRGTLWWGPQPWPEDLDPKTAPEWM